MNVVADDGLTVGAGWLHRQTVVVVVLALTTSMSVGFAVAEGISELAEAGAQPIVPMAPGYGPQPPVILPEQSDPPAEPADDPAEPPEEPCPADDPTGADGSGGVTIDLESGDEIDPPQVEVPDDDIPIEDPGPVLPPDFWESLPVDVCDDPQLRPLCDLVDGGSEWMDEFIPEDGSGWGATDPGDWSPVGEDSWSGGEAAERWLPVGSPVRLPRPW
ncbi:hypothetical protein FB566_3128 [Stackebrandtia endophytica]|uniref:Uncharacterized protein n=1 Tax=Stackebrandtia endophytica TaxID=1496996 RepID=A0A543AYC7_9ACTN|nr:hypothetical protein [Stackebrandtia endophytica]TQL77569.1 hypothetical protein FB566_3128 [Stackebrandtia endophytica]